MKFRSLLLFAAVVLCLSAWASPAPAGQDITEPLSIYTTEHWNQDFAASIPQRLESVWVSGGVQQHVITDRHDNESVDTWAKRHKEAVKGVLQYFPPDNPQHFAGWEISWMQGNTLFSQWVWQDRDDLASIPTTLSTERDTNNGESVARWELRHFMAVRGCLVEMPAQ